MVFSEYKGIRIAAIAAAVPEGIIDIAEMANSPEEDPRFIRNFMKNTGIAYKRQCDFGQTAADYSYSAAKQMQAEGKYNPSEIGVLVNVTQNPDYRTPSTACVLHKRLELSKDCLAFDINLGCSGFVYGVSLASSLLLTSNAKKALVLVGDTLARERKNSKNRRTSNTRLLFGDASAAILLEKKDGYSIKSALMSDGTGYKALATPYGAWKHPEGPESVPGDDIAVFNFTISEVPKLLKEFMQCNHATIDEYDDLILHQANMMIVKNIAKRVKMPMENVPISLDRFGNTSGASVPLTIVDKYGDINEDREVNLLTSAFGIGLSWGVIGCKVNINDILPLTYGKDRFDDGYENVSDEN